MNGVVAVSEILHSGKVVKFTSRLHLPGVGFEFIFGLLSFLSASLYFSKSGAY